jgi:hypothetical protein
MGSNSNYDLNIISSEAGLDKEYLIFRLRKNVKEAKYHLDDSGKSTGSDGEWRSIEEDMRSFSATIPGVVFSIEERNTEYGYEAKHYFQNGRYCCIEPETIWPTFSPEMLL